MLQDIHVDGFRSLREFKFTLRPGLNVLVGPNGAGKSNILRFFEFLSFLSSSRIPEAVSRSGGAGEIFYRLASAQISQQMSFTLNGNAIWHEVDPEDKSSEDNISKKLTYSYEATIKISDDFTSIYFSKQRLKIHFSDNLDVDLEFREPENWDLDFASHVSNEDDVELSLFRYPDDRSIADDDFEQYIKNNRIIRSARDMMLLDIVAFSIRSVRLIDVDFNSGQPFNINPAQVREPEDIAQAAFIRPDGKGLASTLFYLKTPDFHVYPRRTSLSFRKRYKTTSISEIKEYTRLVNDNIVDIEVKNDTFDNKLKVYTTIKTEHNEIVIPLSLLSDGTVKWIALVTAILTSGSIFSLEEPENFLHPRMQIEIINMLRSSMEVSSEYKFALLTTHSETILNHLQPNEVILTKMEFSRTEAVRIEDPDNLRHQIRETGFGLGFFYVAGVL